MYSVWKVLLLVATILLVICAAYGVSLWYQLNATEKRLANTEVQLADTVVELGAAKAQLAFAKTQLVDTEAQLDTAEAQLDTTQAQLDFTKDQLAIATAELNITRDQLASTRSELEASTNENSQMLSQYAGLRNQINARLGLTPQDKQSFITPGNSAVSARVQEVTGGYSEDVNEYWRDCQRLYRWVADNISYSYDSHTPVLAEDISGELVWRKSYWRMPEETLEDETGDCEDMAVLLASMLLSYNEGNYEVWVLTIRSSVPELPGHVAVAFPVAGGELTVLVPAGNYYTGHPYGSLRSDSASVAVSRWLSYWEDELPGVEIVGAFSETDHQEFSSTAEFLTWLEE